MDTDIVRVLNRYSMGTSAATYTQRINVTSPISHVLVSMTAVQNGTTAEDTAGALAQLGSNVQIKVDGTAVYSASPLDTYNANFYWYGGLPNTIGIGTTTDNEVLTVGFAIPFGRVYSGFAGDEQLALDTAGVSVEFEITYPADAGQIDGRLLSVAVVTHPGLQTRGHIERQVRTISSPATGWDNIVDLPYGQDIFLYDSVFFQTTELDAGTTTDTTTIEQLKLELSAKTRKVNELNGEFFALFNFDGSDSNADIVDDKYMYVNFDGRKDLRDVIRLDQPARWNIEAGDTNAIRVIPGILRLKQQKVRQGA